MHLHDVIRLWRQELVSEAPQVAISEELASATGTLLEAMPRDILPGGLRRDDPTTLQVRLLPAEHRPERPADNDSLDSLEQHLGFELPRSIELLLRLHNGGSFFQPEVDGLPHPLSEPLEMLSTTGIASAYDVLLERLGGALRTLEGKPKGLFGLARRFGTHSEGAQQFSEQLAEVAAGRRNGLQVLPLMRPPGQEDNLVCFVPLAGRLGRVGCSFDETNFLPEHSDDYSFEGIEGWLLALVRGRGCRRVLFT